MRLTRYRSQLAVAAAVTVAAGAAITTTVDANATTGCLINYTVTSQWSAGFGASVTLTNLGDPVASWRLTWSYAAGQTVTQLWGGTVDQAGAQVTVTNAAWNGALATGASVQFGFNGTWTGSNPVPVDYALNGVACYGAGPSTSPSRSSGSQSTPPVSPAQSPSRPSSPPPASQPAGGVLNQVHTVGRVQAGGSGVQYTWPGIYFEGRFRGTGVGLVLNDSNNDYVVQVDGATVATLVTPGQTTYWVNNLAGGDHTVRLAKRTESPWAAGEFGGLVAAAGGSILARPAARSRQIEFIGDSWTAGYGNTSTVRDCSATGGVTRNSDADASFGALAARGLGADYQILAHSGLGMVRNYNGQYPEMTARTYLDQTLQAVWNSTVWQNPGTWRPQVIVVGLGINDFSTALNAGEKWATADSLVADFQATYLAFLDTLRSQFGTGTTIVLTYPHLYDTTALADSVERIVATRTSQGDTRIRSLYYDDSALGLDHLGCDWHPSAHDEQLLAGALTSFLDTLPLAW